MRVQGPQGVCLIYQSKTKLLVRLVLGPSHTPRHFTTYALDQLQYHFLFHFTGFVQNNTDNLIFKNSVTTRGITSYICVVPQSQTIIRVLHTHLYSPNKPSKHPMWDVAHASEKLSLKQSNQSDLHNPRYYNLPRLNP